jgi:methylmalonyl-CoA/ethylmalonyl-CoA epimerase
MILRIDHVGIAVPDLDEAIAFHERVFGLTCTHIEENVEQGVREAMLAAPQGGAMVQLLAPLREDSPIGTFIGRNGPGIQQMAYVVDDIRATAAAMRADGVRLLYDEPKSGTAGALINFVHPKDAGGVLVELVELSTDAHAH